MNEPDFTRKIHRLLPSRVYAWKISDRFHRGIPDAYYAGDDGELWVEYKFLAKNPTRQHTPNLSELQKDWLNARRAQNRNVAVVVGTPTHAFAIRDGAWNHPCTTFHLLTHEDLAQWIDNQVHTKALKASTSKTVVNSSAVSSPELPNAKTATFILSKPPTLPKTQPLRPVKYRLKGSSPACSSSKNAT